MNYHRLKKALGLLVILIAVLLPHFLNLPLNSYSILVIGIVWLFLKYDGRNFSDLGFSLSSFKPQVLIYGVLAAVFIVAFLQLVFFPFIELFINFPETQVEMYDQLVGNTEFYFVMLAMGWLIGGVYEEIIFHGFIFNQLKKITSGKYEIIISFTLTGIIFGLYHLQLGVADALNAFIAGIAYHALALKFKGNLWYSIICHGTYNTIVITMLYLNYI